MTPRVLHICAPGDDFAWALSRAERALGLSSDVIRLFGDDDAVDLDLGTQARTPQDIAARVQAGLRAVLDYDVLHLHGGGLFSWPDLDGAGPAPLLDLQVAKALGRLVVFTASADTPAGVLDEDMRGGVDRLFFRDPALGSRYPEGRYLPECRVDPAVFVPEPPAGSETLRVLCAAPGEETRSALDALASVLDLHVDIVRDGSVSEPDLFRRADLVIDETRPGWYGRPAIAALAMGKAVACPLDEAILSLVADDMRAGSPVHALRPGRAAADLPTILGRRQAWPAGSAAARRYVERWHDPARIAAAMIEVYAGAGDGLAGRDVAPAPSATAR